MSSFFPVFMNSCLPVFVDSYLPFFLSSWTPVFLSLWTPLSMNSYHMFFLLWLISSCLPWDDRHWLTSQQSLQASCLPVLRYSCSSNLINSFLPGLMSFQQNKPPLCLSSCPTWLLFFLSSCLSWLYSYSPTVPHWLPLS